MIHVTFTILTLRPQTPNTVTVTAPDTLLALKALAEKLDCEVQITSWAPFAPSPRTSPEVLCQIADGDAWYAARLRWRAEDATVAELARMLEARGAARAVEAQSIPRAAPVVIPETQPLVPFTAESAPPDVPITPDPVLLDDPDKPGAVRVAAAWGDS